MKIPLMAIIQRIHCVNAIALFTFCPVTIITPLYTLPVAPRNIQNNAEDTCNGLNEINPKLFFKNSGEIYTTAAKTPKSNPASNMISAEIKKRLPIFSLFILILFNHPKVIYFKSSWICSSAQISCS